MRNATKRLPENDGQRILDNCTRILTTAIKKGISAKRACETLGFGKNYVSEVRLTLDRKLESKRFNKRQYTEFSRLYKTYERTRQTA